MEDMFQHGRYNANQMRMEGIVRITNPQHYLYGEKIKDFQIDHANASMTIKLPNGSCELIPISWTDYQAPDDDQWTRGAHLLELSGLLEILKIIKHFKTEEAQADSR
jgi:hypothetical protein